MSSFLNFIFGAVFFLIWIIAGGFITQANVKLTSYKNKDDNLNKAYWYTFWAAFTTWFLVGAAIIVGILAAIGVVGLFATGAAVTAVAPEVVLPVAAEATEAGVEGGVAASEVASTAGKAGSAKEIVKYAGKGVSAVTIAILIAGLILVNVTGILAALAASEMGKSPNYDPTNSDLKKAYDDCITTTVMCLATAGLFIIAIISYIVTSKRKKKKAKEAEELAIKERQMMSQPSLQYVQPTVQYAQPSLQYVQPSVQPNPQYVKPETSNITDQLYAYGKKYLNKYGPALQKKYGPALQKYIGQ